MARYTAADIRNIALVGGPRGGKTSFTEAILHATGAIPRLGTVKDGTTVSDHDPEEREKKHSIVLSALHVDHQGRRLNLIDAPGYPDYVGEAAAALSACETALLCVSATEGLTFPARKAWQLASAAGRARAVLVTHPDQGKGSWKDLVAAIGEALGARCLTLSLPDALGTSFSRVRAVPLDEAAAGDLAPLREALVEAAVEADDAALTRYLEESRAPTTAELERLVMRSMVSGALVPVLCACATDGRGVAEFLEVARACFPSPLDGPFLSDVDGQPVEPGAAGGSAFVFKTVSDPFVGKVCLLRVGTGELVAGQSYVIARTGKPEKIAHLNVVQGKEHKPTDRAVTGDILSVPKIEALETSDTLHDTAHPCRYRPLVAPRPMAARAIEPANHADDVKLSTALKKAHAEDPTFTYERDEATGQLVAHGISVMHIETVMRRIRDRYHVETRIDLPRVALKETITGRADGHWRHKKQTGGRGQFGEVFLRVEPGPRGTGLSFVDDTVGGSIPRQFLPAVEKGVHDAMTKGIIAGYPVVDIVVRVQDGKYHDVDSDEASFKIAGSRAFRDAFVKAHPVLLEPLVDLEVAVPSRFMGAITGDLTARRGHITGMDSLGDTQVVKARVPQRETLTYPTALRSMTSGEGSFESHFHDYDVVPGNIQQEIMAGFKGHQDEE